MANVDFVPPQTPAVAKPAAKLPCPFTAEGMLQPRQLQPPPMFGPRGTTIPPRFLALHYRPPHNNKRNSMPRHHSPRSAHHQRHRHPNHQNTKHIKALPTNFWCETCDRGFFTEAHLQAHLSEHQKCGIDGCQFEGHELMVTKHIQLQHSSGLYEKIKNLETPEDIKKWREERKRRYPSRKNVEQRQQAQAERTKRGELLGDSKSRFGHQRDRRNAPHIGDKQLGKPNQQQPTNKQKRRRQKKPVSTREIEKGDDCASGSDADEENAKMFRGTSAMENYRTTATASKTQNALSALVGMYASDSGDSDAEHSDDGDADIFIISEHLDAKKMMPCADVSNIEMQPAVDDEVVVAVTKTAETLAIEMELDEETTTVEDVANDSGGDGGAPDEQPVQRTTNLPEDPVASIAGDQPESQDSKPRKRQRKRNNGPSSAVAKNQSATKPKSTTLLDLSKRYRNQNTMLEKLLQKDIRHERNVLLQCVRHVVQTQFFGIGSENRKSAEQTAAIDLAPCTSTKDANE